jgi:hypothetical protein
MTDDDDSVPLYQRLSALLNVIPTENIDARQTVFEALDFLDSEGPRPEYPADIHISDQLRLAIRDSGRRQTLAAEAGIPDAVIALFCDGKPGLTLERAESLAGQLGYRIGLFIAEGP